jgi:hypothetical protein
MKPLGIVRLNNKAVIIVAMLFVLFGSYLFWAKLAWVALDRIVMQDNVSYFKTMSRVNDFEEQQISSLIGYILTNTDEEKIKEDLFDTLKSIGFFEISILKEGEVIIKKPLLANNADEDSTTIYNFEPYSLIMKRRIYDTPEEWRENYRKALANYNIFRDGPKVSRFLFTFSDVSDEGSRHNILHHGNMKFYRYHVMLTATFAITIVVGIVFVWVILSLVISGRKKWDSMFYRRLLREHKLRYQELKKEADDARNKRDAAIFDKTKTEEEKNKTEKSLKESNAELTKKVSEMLELQARHKMACEENEAMEELRKNSVKNAQFLLENFFGDSFNKCNEKEKTFLISAEVVFDHLDRLKSENLDGFSATGCYQKFIENFMHKFLSIPFRDYYRKTKGEILSRTDAEKLKGVEKSLHSIIADKDWVISIFRWKSISEEYIDQERGKRTYFSDSYYFLKFVRFLEQNDKARRIISDRSFWKIFDENKCLSDVFLKERHVDPVKFAKLEEVRKLLLGESSAIIQKLLKYFNLG